ncbi:ATP-binding cassette domain-containing protein [Marinobacter daepoensis]|uniref:ATP-binding cassette domain-containing protein n=1 Tax=Marinobacter daepoensis TaxID=262077 RepID=UPI001C94C5D4|nr:ATP-binding cassette domain-containing protein [Marinobacter daepoensis]MBY6033951.1 ATP-binding cassette domain-containing protein [Marinobacter daepoensis]
MLEIRIRREASGHSILGDIQASVAPGDRICLLGPSGTGKTTLLNAIAGLDHSMAEESILGRDRLRVGYLFQEHRLLPWRTLNANLKLAGASEREAEWLLSQVGLSGYGHYLPDQLSLGMARRAALARCLAVKPDLLLLDEPFASLDPVIVGELKARISAILSDRPGMAMICVTHDGNDAAALANRLWYLEGRPARLRWDGAVHSQASTSALMSRLRGVAKAV